MKLDPNERRFYLVRIELDSRGEHKVTPTNPATGTDSNDQDPSTWMSFDDAKKWADHWGARTPGSSVAYGVKAVLKFPPDAKPGLQEKIFINGVPRAVEMTTRKDRGACALCACTGNLKNDPRTS